MQRFRGSVWAWPSGVKFLVTIYWSGHFGQGAQTMGSVSSSVSGDDCTTSKVVVWMSANTVGNGQQHHLGHWLNCHSLAKKKLLLFTDLGLG